MVNINVGDSVVLGHKSSSNDPDMFKNFSFYICKDVNTPNEYILHRKYEECDHIAVRYHKRSDKIDVLKERSFISRQETQDVMYCDTFECKHRYFVFLEGKIDPRLSAVGPNKIHARVHGNLDGTDKFKFTMSSNSFMLTENNDFNLLSNRHKMQVHSTDNIPFVFSHIDKILSVETEGLITSLQVV